VIITSDIKYIGVNDRELDLFEGQYAVPNGMAYNSYAILDEKIAILDTVEAKFGGEWMKSIDNLLGDKEPSYLIVQHMEPDHSSSITLFMNKYPSAVIVASDKAFAMMKQFYKNDYEQRRIIIKEKDTLSLGKHTLTFYSAPMIHWPEVFVTYDSYDKVLFSADAFGKFGATDTSEEWVCEARRYYFGIVGKYGAQVQRLLAKLSDLEINIICSLHGPVLKENLGYYIGLYDTWSKYDPEVKGVFIAYTSIYGNTKEAALKLAELLKIRGVKVSISDLARDDVHKAIEDAFKYGTLVLASPTYNNEAFPPMREFINHLCERDYQKRRVAIIENGSWAPSAAKKIKEMLQDCKALNILENTVTIRSSLSCENGRELESMADELCK